MAGTAGTAAAPLLAADLADTLVELLQVSTRLVLQLPAVQHSAASEQQEQAAAAADHATRWASEGPRVGWVCCQPPGMGAGLMQRRVVRGQLLGSGRNNPECVSATPSASSTAVGLTRQPSFIVRPALP